MPRQCGIATLTTDLSDAIAVEFSKLDCFVVAVNDTGKSYASPRGSALRSLKTTSRRTGVPPVGVCLVSAYNLYGMAHSTLA